MKKLVAIAVVTAGIGFFSAPAFAADPVAETCGISGVISSYSLLGWTNGASDRHGDGYGAGVAGKVNTCDVFGTGLNMQSDVYAEYSEVTGGNYFDGYNATSIGSVNHLYWRDPDSFAFGVLFGLNHFAESYSDEPDGIDAVIGADAHLYFGNLTLATQAAYWNNFSTEGSDAYADIDEAWEVSLEGRYFVTDNLKLTARASYDWNTCDENNCGYGPWDAYRFGGGAEYQFDGSPLSFFANYTRVEGSIEHGANLDSDIVKFGLSLHLNQDTLRAEDRNGASFSTPYVDSWTNVTNAVWR
jgi:hypothetical protein